MTMTDRRDILDRLKESDRACVASLDCFDEIDSTSDWLLREAPPDAGRCRIAIADRQTAGRGRREREWTSPAGAGLWLSLAHTFADRPPESPALTLAVGASLAEALQRLGAVVRLKWPNDLMAGDGKLGGILTEMRTRGVERSVTIGVGINTGLPAAVSRRIEGKRGTTVTDLRACLAEPPGNAELAARVIGALLESIRRFAAGDLAASLAMWRRYDWLAGKQVTIEQPKRRIAGMAEGIDADGALLIRSDGRIQRITFGSVVLQEAAEACA